MQSSEIKAIEPSEAAQPWRAIRLAGVSTAAIAATWLGHVFPATAKVPGEAHCYGGICHRVRSVEEVSRLIGQGEDTIASFYDEAGRDRFNTGTITSSGERFDADSARRVSSSVYPDGTELLLWNPKNGRVAHVRVNDFGPFYRTRTLDVTRRIAEDLGFHRGGVTTLRVIVISAPTHIDARYRRNRRYADPRGFIGSLTEREVASLAGDLISDARDRDKAIAAQTVKAPVETAEAAIPTATAQTETALGKPGATPPAWITLAEGVPAPKPLAPTTAALMAHAVDFARHAPSETPPETPASLQQLPVIAEATNAPAQQPAIEPGRATVAETPSVEPASPTVVAQAESEIPPLLRTVYASGSQMLVQATGLIAMATSSRGGHDGHTANPDYWMPRVTLGLVGMTMMWWMALGRPRTRRLAATPQRSASTTCARSTGGAEPVSGNELASEKNAQHSRDNITTSSALALPDLPTATVQPAGGSIRRDLASRLTELADNHSEAGRFAKAERRYRMALYIRERQLGAGHPDVLGDLKSLAAFLKRNYRHADAERVLHRLIAVTEKTGGELSPELAAPLRHWADCARDQGRLGEAEASYRRALEIAERSEADDPGSVADVLDERALLFIKRKRVQEALADAKRALSLRWRELPVNENGLAVSLSILAEARRLNGELLASETAHREALSRFMRTAGPQSLQSAGSMTSLAEVLAQRGMTQEARQLLETALPIFEARLGLRHPGLASVHHVLVAVHVADGEIDTAVRLRRKSLEIIETVLGHDHAECVAARGHLAALIAQARVTDLAA